MPLAAAARALSRDCRGLDLPVAYVYDPLDYAWEAHQRYCETFGVGRKRALLVGMNPGPHGMGQTGVPFGDVVWVRDWMGITGAHKQPDRTHPKRPITGFATKRREPSGSRLYGWADKRFGSAAAFFDRFFVVNYCPLLFYDDDGRNVTPPQLPEKARASLDEACDRHLAAVARVLSPEIVIGVGAFAEERARSVVVREGLDARVGRVLHPSPASPAANRGWEAQAEAQLAALGVL